MGAEYFEDFVNIKDVKEAFKHAVDEALYDHGHSGYSGTIAEKDSYKILHEEPVTKKMAKFLTHENENEVDDKWGPCGAIRVIDDKFDGWIFFGWASS
jgi:hypothetical protein